MIRDLRFVPLILVFVILRCLNLSGAIGEVLRVAITWRMIALMLLITVASATYNYVMWKRRESPSGA